MLTVTPPIASTSSRKPGEVDQHVVVDRKAGRPLDRLLDGVGALVGRRAQDVRVQDRDLAVDGVQHPAARVAGAGEAVRVQRVQRAARRERRVHHVARQAERSPRGRCGCRARPGSWSRSACPRGRGRESPPSSSTLTRSRPCHGSSFLIVGARRGLVVGEDLVHHVRLGEGVAHDETDRCDHDQAQGADERAPSHDCQRRGAGLGRSTTNVPTTTATQSTRQTAVTTAARVRREGSNARSSAARGRAVRPRPPRRAPTRATTRTIDPEPLPSAVEEPRARGPPPTARSSPPRAPRSRTGAARPCGGRA